MPVILVPPARFVKHKAQFKALHLFDLKSINNQWMDIVFADPVLGLIETEEAGRTGLPVPVIKSARRKFTVLRAAVDGRSLMNWKSLHYEKLKGDRAGQRSVRLNDQYRMVFTLEESARPHTIAIIGIEVTTDGPEKDGAG